MLASLGIGGATWLAFVVIAVVVLALVGYLGAVIWILKKVSFTLGTVVVGVKAIAYATSPVAEVVSGIASNVGAIQNALRGLLGLTPASMGRGVVPAGARRPMSPADPARRSPDAPAPLPAGSGSRTRGTGRVSMRR